MSQNKISVLFLLGVFNLGGKERQMTELIRNLPKDQFELHLLVKEKGAYYMEAISGNLDSFYSLDLKKFKPSSVFSIIKYINRIKPDIIHSWALTTSDFAILSKVFCKKRFILIDGSIRQAPPNFSFFNKFGLERLFISAFSDSIVSNSHAGLVSYSAPARKSRVVYNGFDQKRIENLLPAEEIRRRFGITTKYLVAKVARFDPEKEYLTFVHAAQKVLALRKDVTFIAIGEGPGMESVMNEVLPEFKDYIKFPGKQSDVESIVNCIDIGVLCTKNRRHGEGISNSIMEYMACGKPVIATEGGGTRELVMEGKTGFIIPTSSVEELTARLNELLDDEALRKKMGSAGRERIMTEFCIETMTKRYVDIYQELVKK